MSDPYVSDLLELPLRVVKQPTPEVSLGGDCGACVLAGLLNLSVEDAYAKLGRQGVRPFSYQDMCSALQTAAWELGLVEHYSVRTPYWPQDELLRAYGDPGWGQMMDWLDWLRMAFNGGYYGIAQVKCEPQQGVFETDHWVLYAGLRTKWEKPRGEAPNCGSFQILVSDSSRKRPHEAWFDVSEHLKSRGGFQVLLAKPGKKDR